MDHAFVAALETWGSGGEFFDVLTLDDGRIIAVTAHQIAVYVDTAAFEEGVPLAVIPRGATIEEERRRAGGR